MNHKLHDSEENPDEWITTLDNLRVRLADVGHKIEDMEFLLHIVVNLPARYDTVVEIVQDGLKDGSLTLEILRAKLKAKFKCLKNFMDTDEEKGLSIVDRKSLTKCQHCGKKGHRYEDCFYL